MKTILLQFLKRYDFSFWGTFAAIFLIGVLNLYSATHTEHLSEGLNLYEKQILFFLLASLLGISISFLNSKTIFQSSYLIYGLNLFLLVLVLVVGQKGMGAQRWLSLGMIRIQPSELMKISLVLALGRWFSKTDPHLPTTLKSLIVPLILALTPAILIIKQPDLGTGLLILLIFSVMVFYRRLRVKTIAGLLVLCSLGGVLMYHFGLKEYQRKRITTFLDPTADARGSGYNAIQSEIAIGSGQFFGKGFMKSSQASLNYLPENQTDFVFSVFNEEHGLFGSLILIALYLVLTLRMIWLSNTVLRFYDALCAIGIMSIFFWHTIINMGMVMGLLPIVGLPLPLMSYGGSSLLTFGICCGLITSISNSKRLF